MEKLISAEEWKAELRDKLNKNESGAFILVGDVIELLDIRAVQRNAIKACAELALSCCRCLPDYKERGLIDPDCAVHDAEEAILSLLPEEKHGSRTATNET
jgi:hypothetical protein